MALLSEKSIAELYERLDFYAAGILKAQEDNDGALADYYESRWWLVSDELDRREAQSSDRVLKLIDF